MHAKNAKYKHENAIFEGENNFFKKKLQKNAKLIKKCAMILASEIFGICEKQPKKAQKNS